MTDTVSLVDYLDMKAKADKLREEVGQCATELEEATKVIRAYYPRVAGIFDQAAKRARAAAVST